MRPPTWIVDPIDGTTNYVHDCPLYCISIGLQVAGKLVVGVVYDPSRQEMFAASQGHGAWLGERRLRTSATSRLQESLLATGFPPDVRGHEETLDWWRYLLLPCPLAQAHRFDGTQHGLHRRRPFRRLLGL